MPVTVGVAGKGGVGKTTVSALLIKLLIQNGTRSVLAVDADPDSNLPDVLGVALTETVGGAADRLRGGVGEEESVGCLVKRGAFDLLVMGRTTGKGCYCAVNSLLRGLISTLNRKYDFVVIDSEAGLEHFSRGVDEDVDLLLIVTDPSRMGFQTAQRIIELSKEVGCRFQRTILIGNRFSDRALPERVAGDMGLEFGGVIPEDEEIRQSNLKGTPLLDLPEGSRAVAAAERFMKRAGLL